MAEGVLGSVLGEEEESREAEAVDGAISADAFAIAVAERLCGHDPQVARDTCAFLREQTRLLKIQVDHLEDEHASRQHYLDGQAREVDIRRFGLRPRVAFQLFAALVAAFVGCGALFMVRDALASRQVVIEPFSAPPSLAPDGLNGRVVASGILDVLTQIQAASRSAIDHRSLSNAWTNQISVELPETGVSIEELQRLLKARFGHDQRIDGDLVKTAEGLALTVRGTGILPKTFNGTAGELDGLMRRAGEYLFGQSQPGLWVAYLTNAGRDDEAIGFAQDAYAKVDASERPYLLNGWANAISDKGGEGALRQALPLYREAVRLNPFYWTGYNNIMYAQANLGDEEGVVQTGLQMMALAGGRPGKAPEFMYQNYDQEVWDLAAERASSIADMEATSGLGTLVPAVGAANLNIAQTEAQMHDTAAAELRLATTRVDPKHAPDVALAAMDRALIAEELGDFAGAARQWDIFAAAYADPAVATSNPPFICYAALAFEKTGQAAKADAALRPWGDLSFVDCYRFKGDLADLRGDWNGARQWYEKAVKLAPSIPSGYYSWGMALARHGELPGAADKFQEANARGPHWADPLKAWGDVLARQGRAADALNKYDQALKFAPNWKQLLQARQELAKPRS